MRVVIATDSFGGTLDAMAAAEAIATGWRRGAPDDETVLLHVADGGTGFVGLDAALDRAAEGGAGLAVIGEGIFDWQSLRGTLVTTVARGAADRGVPCVVLARQVSVGRREAAAVGVDAAYAVADDAEASHADPAAALAALAARVAGRWSRP